MPQHSVFYGKGGDWTLTAYLGDLLEEAEQRFGPRLRQWTPIGVQIGDAGPPSLRFLGDTDKVFIRLSSESEFDIDCALLELAHEVVHLLSPVHAANCLEEGLATHFSLTNRHIDKKATVNRERIRSNHPQYYAALLLFEEFQQAGGDIRALRHHEPIISKIPAGLLRVCVPNLRPELIPKLLGPIDAL